MRTTPPRTPQAELAGFHLPPGFEARLFASEPQIAKPMNLAFDSRGRLWVTDSFEYPYPAAADVPCRDSVRILEDTNGDGLADKVSVFADGLNIPIGVLPYGDGCICFSIPNLYYLRDTDGDGVCDTREVILGPFDTTRDTHGMINSLRLGDDGWIYANHGFNNQSRVAGKDGHEIVMQSGNTFRFLPNGSRVEHVTWGQVNPFGRTSDDWGYDYTADCHSKPISQLVTGGFYPSFGRLDDGLGFMPSMMDHLHGSTAIAGLAFVPESLGIESLAGQMLSGNVMTSRINRNRIVYQGSTAKAVELPDFLTSDDPWFRPVDIRLGPDGYLYVADFYNRIIGHYEVPLEHPGRDRERGRIWQIRYTGVVSTDATKNWKAAKASLSNNVVSEWGSPNPVRRRLALQDALKHGQPALDASARELILKEDSHARDARLTAAAYLLQRQELDPTCVIAMSEDSDAIVRARILRLLSSSLANSGIKMDVLRLIVRERLTDANPHVRRVASELAGQIGGVEMFSSLLSQLAVVPSGDPLLRQTIRIAIRNLLRQPDSDVTSNAIAALGLATGQKRELASIMLAVQSTIAGEYLAEYIGTSFQDEPKAKEILVHIVRLLPEARRSEAIALARKLSRQNLNAEQELLEIVANAAGKVSREDLPELHQWADDIASRALANARTRVGLGQPISAGWNELAGKNWPTQQRMTATGEVMQVSSSFMLGESYTGVYQTQPFDAPASISFWLVGHNGNPGSPDNGNNRIQLIEVSTGQVLASAFPPRSDVAETVLWDCSTFKGRRVAIQCIDNDDHDAYAWIAFGGFQPDWIEPMSTPSAVENYFGLVRKYRLIDQRTGLVQLIEDLSSDSAVQLSAAAALADVDDRKTLATILNCASEFGIEGPYLRVWIRAVLDGSVIDDVEQASRFADLLSAENQLRFAERLSGDRALLPLLIEVVEQGAIAPNVLLEKTISDRLDAVGTDALMERVNRLRGLASMPDANTENLVTEVIQQVRSLEYDAQIGASLFAKHCSACHQLAGQGQVVGPQLDGVGGRGAARLAEDIMLPDRNVDKAFRTTTFLTTDGQVLTGLVRDENEERILLVGQDGKSTEIRADDIETKRAGTHSLMPGNFHEALGPEKTATLIAFLMHAGSKK